MTSKTRVYRKKLNSKKTTRRRQIRGGTNMKKVHIKFLAKSAEFDLLQKLPINTGELICSGIGLTELPNLLEKTPNLVILDCRNNELTNLPNLPPTLRILYCEQNEIIELPNLLEQTPNLQELNCADNELTQLPDLPSTLRILDCADNELTQLPDLPQTLEYLFCFDNSILNLPNLRVQTPNLKKLLCFRNMTEDDDMTEDGYKMKELPDLPETLEILDCYENGLTHLPKLPQALQQLNCWDNKLIELPNLPDNLEILDCYDNELKYLPDLPLKLKILRCSLNELTELPNLPESLEVLECNGSLLNKYMIPTQSKIGKIRELVNAKNAEKLQKDTTLEGRARQVIANNPSIYANLTEEQRQVYYNTFKR